MSLYVGTSPPKRRNEMLPTDEKTVLLVAQALHKSGYKDRADPWAEIAKDYSALMSWRSAARDFIHVYNELVAK
jgi:hypothetical protein